VRLREDNSQKSGKPEPSMLEHGSELTVEVAVPGLDVDPNHSP